MLHMEIPAGSSIRREVMLAELYPRRIDSAIPHGCIYREFTPSANSILRAVELSRISANKTKTRTSGTKTRQTVVSSGRSTATSHRLPRASSMAVEDLIAADSEVLPSGLSSSQTPDETLNRQIFKNHLYGNKKEPALYSKAFFETRKTECKDSTVKELSQRPQRLVPLKPRRKPREEAFANSTEVEAVINDFLDHSRCILDHWASINGPAPEVFLTE